MPKDMLFKDDARRVIFAGVKKLAQAVKATLGPTGRNVVIKKEGRPPFITKDGVTVANEVSLVDKFEDLGAELVREVASKTASAAGDGTTTATVLAEAILEAGSRHLATGVNATELKRGIDLAVEAVIAHLCKISKPVSNSEEMLHVASISANHDQHAGSLIANLIEEIGPDGVATIEKSGTSETFVERVDGLQLKGGYINQYFRNKDTGEAVWEDPRILLYSGRITSARDLILGNSNGFLERALSPASGSKPIVIIAEGVDGEALHALVMNRVQGGQAILAVKMPFVLNRDELLEDIAVLTGGKVFSQAAGHKLHKIDLDELGGASRIVANEDKTLILKGKGDPKAIQARIDAINEKIKTVHTEEEKRSLKERAAKLGKGIAVIRVGGSSEVEFKERHDRIEDALYATQAAVEEGIVPGGGVALVRCIEIVRALIPTLANDDQKMGAAIIEKAISSPLRQIADNSGTSGEVVLEKVLAGTGAFGYDAKHNKYCDMMKTGIIDPAKVVKCAIRNAASVAGLVLTTDVLLIERPLEVKKADV